MKRNKQKKRINRVKPIGFKALSSRTMIGIICIIAALGICFGVAPLVNQVSDGKTEVVRIKDTLPQGSIITENFIEVVKVGNYNLPKDVLRKKEDVLGKYTTVDLYAGDYLLPGKITSDMASANDILGGLAGDQKVISVTIGSFAQGVSGKLETGDIISVIVYSQKEGKTETPAELRYLRVVTSTTSKGVDKADVVDQTQPVTVTLIVNREQAEMLALYEETATMHFTLEYRGDAAVAQQYLDEQAAYFKTKGET